MEDRDSSCYSSSTATPGAASETASALPIWQLMAADWQVLTMGPDTYGAFVSDGDHRTVSTAGWLVVGEYGPETVTLPVGSTVIRMATADRPDDPDDGVPALIHR